MTRAYMSFGANDEGDLLVSSEPLTAVLSLEIETEDGKYKRKHEIKGDYDRFTISRFYQTDGWGPIGDAVRLLPRYVDGKVRHAAHHENVKRDDATGVFRRYFMANDSANHFTPGVGHALYTAAEEDETIDLLLAAIMEGEGLDPKADYVTCVTQTDDGLECSEVVVGATSLLEYENDDETTGHKVTDTVIRDLIDIWTDVPDGPSHNINNVFPDDMTLRAARTNSRYVVQKAKELEEMKDQQQTS